MVIWYFCTVWNNLGNKLSLLYMIRQHFFLNNCQNYLIFNFFSLLVDDAIQWATAKRARTPKWHHSQILLFCFEIKTFVIRDVKYVVNHWKKLYCIIFSKWVNCLILTENAITAVNWHCFGFLLRTIFQALICAIF